jgi:exodeoxyribonuclease VII small subunit
MKVTEMNPEHPLPVEEMSYEQAFTSLEDIVSLLETEKHSLEQSMALFERGQALAARCAALLDQAELKVQRLMGEDLEPFSTQG